MSRNILVPLLVRAAATVCLRQEHTAAGPVNHAGSTRFGPAQLGVIVNDDDPVESERLPTITWSKRGIPAKNLVHVRISNQASAMSCARRISGSSRQKLMRRHRKAYRPGHSPGRPRTASAVCRLPRHLRSGSMMHSVSEDCKLTRQSPYFDSDSRRPWKRFWLAPGHYAGR